MTAVGATSPLAAVAGKDRNPPILVIRRSAVQADDGESLGTQQRVIEGYAMMQGLPLDAVFVERGVSGSKPLGERPEGARLLAALKSGDTVIAAKLDRMFRSALNALDVLGQSEGPGRQSAHDRPRRRRDPVTASRSSCSRSAQAAAVSRRHRPVRLAGDRGRRPCRRSRSAARHPAHPRTSPRGPVAAGNLGCSLRRGPSRMATR